MNFQDRISLITGGSSGIGLATAKLMAAEGSHVWLVARNLQRLEAALTEVNAARRSPTQCCGAIPADVSDPAQAESAVRQVSTTVGPPDIVVNSAGIVLPGYFEDLDLSAFRRQIEINYLGAVYVIKAALPAMFERRSGHIVNVSSAAGFLGMLGYTAYGGAKYALRGFSDALRAEVRPRGIGLSIVFPPDTDTPQLTYDKATRPREIDRILGSKVAVQSPESVGRAILNGIAHRRYVITPGLDTTFLYWLVNVLGPLQYPILDFLIDRALRQTGRAQLVNPTERVQP